MSRPAPPDDAELRPTWRGTLHRFAALAAVPMFAVLVALAPTATVRIAIVIYAVGIIAMLGVSAVYHSGRLSAPARAAMRRVDHSTILPAIAGSYTSVSVLALSGSAERNLLTFVWIAAAVGVAIRMLWLRAPYAVTAAVYLAVGWSALVELGPLTSSLSVGDSALLWGGGALYSIGAVVYATRRPDPRPAVFGYHEVFHALVVAAALLHYLLVLRLVLGRR